MLQPSKRRTRHLRNLPSVPARTELSASAMSLAPEKCHSFASREHARVGGQHVCLQGVDLVAFAFVSRACKRGSNRERRKGARERGKARSTRREAGCSARQLLTSSVTGGSSLPSFLLHSPRHHNGQKGSPSSSGCPRLTRIKPAGSYSVGCARSRSRASGSSKLLYCNTEAKTSFVSREGEPSRHRRGLRTFTARASDKKAAC